MQKCLQIEKKRKHMDYYKDKNYKIAQICKYKNNLLINYQHNLNK